MTMEKPPKPATLNTVAAIMEAYEDGSLKKQPLLVLTHAVTLLEDVRFEMIQKKQDTYALPGTASPVTLTRLRQVGDYMNELRNATLQDDAINDASSEATPAPRMRVEINTNGANLQPEIAELVDLFTSLHTEGSLKATYQTRDVLDSPIWLLELTAPQLTLKPLFTARRVVVNTLTVRRSGANCVVWTTVTVYHS